jgi:hypothetical protein
MGQSMFKKSGFCIDVHDNYRYSKFSGPSLRVTGANQVRSVPGPSVKGLMDSRFIQKCGAL